MKKKINNYNELFTSTSSFVEDFCTTSLGSRAAEISTRYSMNPPGKCFRSILHLSIGRLLGIEPAFLRQTALSLELIHAASLIHDDLPCIDNDDLRRGRPSSHKVFGEALALLTGDRMFFQALNLAANSSNLSSEGKVFILERLSRAGVEICDGQVLDLIASGKISKNLFAEEVTTAEVLSGDSTKAFNCKMKAQAEQELESRHLQKTGALIEAAAVTPLGFLDSNIREKLYPLLSNYGLMLGLLFQITDDILDSTSSETVLGKPTQSDALRDCPNYVSVFGLEGAKSKAEEVEKKALDAISAFKTLVFDRREVEIDKAEESELEFLKELVGIIKNRSF